MDLRRNVFLGKDPYDFARVAPFFTGAVRENLIHHRANCPQYARLLALLGFDPASLRAEGDLVRIPPLPTLFLKRHPLGSVPEEKLILRATSSGTSGTRSALAFDRETYRFGVGAVVRLFAYLGLISAVPANYIVLSYPPRDGVELGAAQTARGATRFAPALSRVYALKKDGSGGYAPDIEGVAAALARFAKSPFPVRFTGFPAYLYALCSMLDERNMTVKLPRGSLALLGGGFKGMEGGSDALYPLAERTLGLPRERIFEFFSAAEHPLAYYKCKNGHFHIPAYSRVYIRGADGLSVLPDGEAGLLSFVSPLVTSMPLACVMTDDVAVRSPGGCGCGIESPYFTLLGRAGASGIVTCAAKAAEALAGEGGTLRV
ncbi:MAG TPA: acyl-protein synthetase [Clostridia bacterium]|nr:acyl-protein synthetase [Clostridia bacterium]